MPLADCTPTTLISGAKSFMGTPRTSLLSMWIYALTQAHPLVTTTDPGQLLALAKNYNGIPDDSMKLAVVCYLLALLAGGSTDPGTLLASAKNFMGMEDQHKLAVIAYLSCQFA